EHGLPGRWRGARPRCPSGRSAPARRCPSPRERHLDVLAERGCSEALQKGAGQDRARPARVPAHCLLDRNARVHAGGAARARRFPGAACAVLLHPNAAPRVLHPGGQEAVATDVRDPGRPAARGRPGPRGRRPLRPVLAGVADAAGYRPPGSERVEGARPAVQRVHRPGDLESLGPAHDAEVRKPCGVALFPARGTWKESCPASDGRHVPAFLDREALGSSAQRHIEVVFATTVSPDLTPFGFTPTESLVYTVLLRLGPSTGY